MRVLQPRSNFFALVSVVAFLVAGGGSLQADERYQVTIENLTPGQPFSPVVAATHRSSMRMFDVGSLASMELEAIAEDGNQIPMFDLFMGSSKVTDVVDIMMPLTPEGTTVGSFSDSFTFDITAQRGDKLSLATMLICTNDGFTGLDRVKLPKSGSTVRWLNGYDAGTEKNTEASGDIVDPCSGLGPVALPGDPNGNENDAVDTSPREPIHHHPNVMGGADLTTTAHAWTDPVAKVTITRISDSATKFRAGLSGVSEVSMVETVANGRAEFKLKTDKLDYDLKADFIVGVLQAHIHLGLPDANGPPVAFLFGPVSAGGAVHGRIAKGTIHAGDLLGPLAGEFASFVDALRHGDLYVNVHTMAHPSGEVRGQIGAK